MRVTEKMHAPQTTQNLSVRSEKILIYLTVISFLSIAGIYLLFI